LAHLRGEHAEYQIIDSRSLSGGIDGVIIATTIAISLLGAISLCVAGIGILNMMLVTVNERTREIGLRKALGATRRAVLLQFLIEALVLCGLGCTLGLLFGVTGGWIIDRFAVVHLAGVVPPIPWLASILVGAGTAAFVTVVFGTLPAYRAARLDPIEALRYE
jgi:putative ABC transport system permease protein